MGLKDLGDEEFLARLKNLVSRERENVADIVAHLAEVDERELVLERAYPSLFAYCVRELGYTPAAAYFRIRAARAVRLFPRVLDLLRSGELSLEAVVRLKPHLDAEKGADLLEAARGKSTREVEVLAAGICPEPDRPDFTRVLSVRREPPNREPAAEGSLFSALEPPAMIPETAPSEPATDRQRIQFSFTADEDVFLLLRRAQEILRHKYPAGRFEDIFHDALVALLEKRDPDWRLLGKLPKRTSESLARPGARKGPQV
jgi:hypothetical protein